MLRLAKVVRERGVLIFDPKGTDRDGAVHRLCSAYEHEPKLSRDSARSIIEQGGRLGYDDPLWVVEPRDPSKRLSSCNPKVLRPWAEPDAPGTFGGGRYEGISSCHASSGPVPEGVRTIDQPPNNTAMAGVSSCGHPPHDDASPSDAPHEQMGPLPLSAEGAASGPLAPQAPHDEIDRQAPSQPATESSSDAPDDPADQQSDASGDVDGQPVTSSAAALAALGEILIPRPDLLADRRRCCPYPDAARHLRRLGYPDDALSDAILDGMLARLGGLLVEVAS